MDLPLSSNTPVTIGLVALVGGSIAGVFRWLFNIKKDVDRHTVQLNKIEDDIKETANVYGSIQDTMRLTLERMARVETKLDLILEKKIK